MVGERVEIMVNLGSDQIGSSLNLMAYNSGQTFGFPGSEPGTNGAFGSLLNNLNFNVLHINVIASTNNPIISLPSNLTSNSYYTSANATVTRTINITNGNPGPNPIPFNFDNTSFAIGTINKTINLNDIEKWTIINNNVFGHTFHIHDVEFKIVDRNGSPTGVGSHESGWKDVIYVPRNESISFVAKFDDFADAIHPFMYHCHFSNHEDEGMMGQFIVTNTITTVNENIINENEFMLYPNPAKNILNVSFDKSYMQAYYIRIINSSGKTLMMLPKPNLENGIDINGLKSGTYFLQLTDEKNKLTNTKKFIKD